MNLLEFLKKINDYVEKGEVESLPKKIKADGFTYFKFITKSEINGKNTVDYSIKPNGEGNNFLVDLHFGFRNGDLRFIEVEELEQGTLTNEERDYLENIIKPFKNDSKFIIKKRNGMDFYRIIIIYENDDPYEDSEIVLHNFKKKEHYFEGLEENVKYTLEDLNL